MKVQLIKLLVFVALMGGFYAFDGFDRPVVAQEDYRSPRRMARAWIVTVFLFVAGAVMTLWGNAIAQHVDWISDCIAWMGHRQAGAIEATEPAQDEWVEHVNAGANTTSYPLANSWYLGANVPGHPRVFMPYIGGFPTYRDKCAEVAANGYEGFQVTAGGR